MNRNTKTDHSKNNVVFLTLVVHKCVPVVRLDSSRTGAESPSLPCPQHKATVHNRVSETLSNNNVPYTLHLSLTTGCRAQIHAGYLGHVGAEGKLRSHLGRLTGHPTSTEGPTLLPTDSGAGVAHSFHRPWLPLGL